MYLNITPIIQFTQIVEECILEIWHSGYVVGIYLSKLESVRTLEQTK